MRGSNGGTWRGWLGHAAEGLLECVVELVSSLLKLSLVLACGLPAAAQETPIGKQSPQEFRVSESQTVPYLLHLPAGYDAAADKKWPLMLFLHGRGESFGPLSIVAKWGPPQIASTDENFPYILVSPQCPRDDSWTSERQQAALVQLLDQVLRDHRVDTDRVYLTGLSMGGYGSWKLSAAHPERFAAVAPVCGGGDPAQAERLKSMPLWVWHGDRDTAVPIAKSDEMVQAIRAAGSTSVRYTTLEAVGHNSWSAAYATPELYAWFNQFTISARK